MRIISFRRWMWHGVATPESWRRICKGDGLKLPTPGQHAHDVGDYGLAVYLSTSLSRAKVYAHRVEGGWAVVRARVELERAILMNWREGAPRMAQFEGAAWDTINELSRLYGDPVRGTDDARLTAARRWRSELLKQGIEGIVAVHDHDTEAAVYAPERSIKAYECRVVAAKSRAASPRGARLS